MPAYPTEKAPEQTYSENTVLPQVLAEVERSRAIIADVEKAFDALYSRLSYVLCHVPECAGDEACEPSPSKAPLAETLAETNARLASLARRVGYTLSVLEV